MNVSSPILQCLFLLHEMESLHRLFPKAVVDINGQPYSFGQGRVYPEIHHIPANPSSQTHSRSESECKMFSTNDCDKCMAVREHQLPKLPDEHVDLVGSNHEYFPSNPSSCHCSSASCSSHAKNYYEMCQILYRRNIICSRQLAYIYSRDDPDDEAFKRDLEAMGITETSLKHFGLFEKKESKHHHCQGIKMVFNAILDRDGGTMTVVDWSFLAGILDAFLQ